MPFRKPSKFAKALRKAMPPAERQLWTHLRNKQLGGYRFRRQHTIGPYVADFACLETRIIIELDGDQHGRDDGPARDQKRDAFITEQSWRVLRFWNNDVYENIEGVLDVVLGACEFERRAKETKTTPFDESE